MKQTTLTLIIILVALFSIACKQEATIEVSAPAPQTTEAATTTETAPMTATNDTAPVVKENSCQTPTPDRAPSCAALEAQILASTVRIVLHRWNEVDGQRGEHIDGGVGHATVKDGRYLITHNHFSMPLASLEGTAGEQVRLSVYKANGEVILDNVRPTAFSIVAQDSETVILDFGQYGEDGLLGILGAGSAAFAGGQAVAPAPGTEVAQINWNNEVAHVEWTNVRSVTMNDGTPRIELDNGVIEGASGGGIFWNGTHIGNNWTSTTIQTATGAVTDAYSTAALNPISVTN